MTSGSTADNTPDLPLKDRLGPQFFDALNRLPDRWREPAEELGRSTYTSLQDSRPRIARLAQRAAAATGRAGLDQATLPALKFAARADPTVLSHWMRLARFHLDDSNPEQAIVAMEKAISAKPDLLPPYLSKAEIEDDLDPARADTTLRRAVLACPQIPKRRQALRLLQQRDVRLPPALERFYIDRVNDDPKEPERVTTAQIVEATNLFAFDILDDGRSTPAVRTAVDHLLIETPALAIAERLGDQRFVELPYKTIRTFVEKLHSDGHISESLRYARLAEPANPTSAWLAGFIDRRAREKIVLDAGVITLDAQTVRPVAPGGETTALYFLHNSLPKKSGGYATRTHGLLTGLKQAGHQVVGVTRPGFPSVNGVFDQQPDVDETDEVHGITYHRLVSQKKVMPRHDINRFASHYADLAEKFVDMYQPSVIHAASNWWNGFGALACARRHDLPMVYEVRGLWELTRASREPGWGASEAYDLDAIYEASVAKQADRVVTLSGAMRDELVRRGVDGSTISIVPNAVDLTQFATRPPDRDLMKKHQLEGKTVFGFAGTITFYEGLELLLQAVADMPVLKRGKIALLIVGDGPVLPSLKAQAKELGIAHLVRFVGRVPHQEVVNYLSVMDVTPFPRLPLPVCEAVPPIKPLESMSMGRAVLVSNVHVLEEMIDDRQTGLVVEAGSVDALRHACEELVDSPELISELGRNARSWAEQNRGWSAVSKTLAEVYEELR